MFVALVLGLVAYAFVSGGPPHFENFEKVSADYETAANEASLAFHRAVGYRHTATLPDCGYKFGTWHGIVWMEGS